jgi:hypothetical protein
MDDVALTIFRVFFSILFVWSFVWFALSIVRLLQKDAQKYLWASHAGWALVNISIVVLGIYTLNSATIDSSFVTSQRNIVAFNILLDVVYVVIAHRLLRSTKTVLQQVGKAVRVQGAFLFFFDIVFAAGLTLVI